MPQSPLQPISGFGPCCVILLPRNKILPTRSSFNFKSLLAGVPVSTARATMPAVKNARAKVRISMPALRRSLNAWWWGMEFGLWGYGGNGRWARKQAGRNLESPRGGVAGFDYGSARGKVK